MAGIYRWHSLTGMTTPGSDVSYSVGRYAEGIRKQAALLKHSPGLTQAVAYFRDDQEAREFAAIFLGGVHEHQEEGVDDA